MSFLTNGIKNRGKGLWFQIIMDLKDFGAERPENTAA